MQNNSSKNYYHLLQVKQDASIEEIKRSYRRLAMKYHPDKNAGDMLGTKIFLDITEAYETLSDADKRKGYDYKTYTNAGKDHLKRQVISADHIWRESISLKKIVRTSDPFSINRDALFFRLSELITNENMYMLKKENDNSLMESFTENILFCCSFLQIKESAAICSTLLIISSSQVPLDTKIKIFLLRQKQIHNWEKYKIFLAIVATFALCLLVYFINR